MFRHIMTTIIGLSLAVALAACTADTAEERIQRAQAALADNDLKSAAIELRGLLQDDGNNAEARLLLAQVYFNAQDLLAAEKELLRARDYVVGEQINLLLPSLARTWVGIAKYDDILELSLDGLEPEAAATVMAAQALALMDQVDLPGAEKLAREALELDAESLFGLYSLAQIQARNEQYTAAQATLGQLLALDDNFGMAWALRGDISRRSGNLDAADADFTRALTFYPNSQPLRYRRAILRIEMQNFDGANEDVDSLLLTAPANTEVNYLKGLLHYHDLQFQQAITRLLVALPDKQKNPEILLYLAMSYVAMEQQAEAYRYAGDFHAARPDHALGSRLLARQAISQGDLEVAEEVMKNLLASSPEDAEALTLLAHALFSQGRIDDAVAYQTRVVELQPSNLDAKVRLSAGFTGAGRSEEAIVQMMQVLQEDPASEAANTALVRNLLLQDEVDRALEVAQEYARQDPDSPMPYLLQGRAYLQKEHLTAAKVAFELAEGHDPGNPEANHQLAALAAAEQDFAAVEGHYARVLEHYPDRLQTLLALAALEGMQGDEQKMISLLERAVAAHPGAVGAALALAHHYQANTEPARAAAILEGLDPASLELRPVRYLLALSYTEQGLYRQARELLEPVVDSQNAGTAEIKLLSFVYRGMGEPERALQALEQAHEKSPEDPNTLIPLLASAMSREGAEDEVAGYIATLQRIAPDNVRFLSLLGRQAASEGNVDAASDYYMRALQFAGTNGAMLQLTRHYATNGNKAAAREVLESWLVANDDDVVARMAYADYLDHEGQVEAANEQYREVVRLDADHVAALNNLAWSLIGSDPAKALGYARHALELAPEAVLVQDTYAMALHANGDHEEAMLVLRRLLEAYPGEPEFSYHYARVAVDAGQPEDALGTLQRLFSTPELANFEDRDAALALYRELGRE